MIIHPNLQLDVSLTMFELSVCQVTEVGMLSICMRGTAPYSAVIRRWWRLPPPPNFHWTLETRWLLMLWNWPGLWGMRTQVPWSFCWIPQDSITLLRSMLVYRWNILSLRKSLGKLFLLYSLLKIHFLWMHA